MSKINSKIKLALFAVSSAFLLGAEGINNPEQFVATPTTILEAKCDINAGFRTQTIGGWASVPRGDNPGQFLKLFFTEAFPSGLVVGKGSKTISFTGAQAVSNFLPSTGTSKAIDRAFVNPMRAEIANTFASQLIGAAINVTFDGFDNAFSISPFPLSGLVLNQGALAGKTVSQVMAFSHAALAGENVGFSISDLNAALTLINESFVDGKKAGSGLRCP